MGNLTGLYQPNLKRMLAYSSISHSGYMLLAIIAFTPASGNALLFYALSYSIATITAFGILILVREAHGNDYFTSMNGLAKSNPMEAFCLTVALLSLTGIPPLAGFMAKYYLFVTAIGQGVIWLVIIAVTGSTISAVYYFKPIIAMYLKEPTGVKLAAETTYKIHLLFMTLLVILIGILPFLVIGLL
jgi:NADH-quinone oxidoreductase subunit N